MNTNKKTINQHSKAIFFVILEAFCFSLMSFFVKLSGNLPTMQKAFFRNIVAAVMSIVILSRTPEKFHIKKETSLDVLMRCIFGSMGLFLNFWAIDHLNLADANILNKMSPFFAIIMSIFILKEVPSFFEIMCLIAAFTGVAFVVKPSAGIQSLPAIIALLGGFGAGTAYTFLRKATTRGERGPLIVMCFSVFSTIISLPFLILDFHSMSIRQLLCLIAAGTAAAFAQLAITKAYSLAPAKEISVFDYTQVLFASLWGILFFGELPDLLSITGYIIIIGTAIIKWKIK